MRKFLALVALTLPACFGGEVDEMANNQHLVTPPAGDAGAPPTDADLRPSPDLLTSDPCEPYAAMELNGWVCHGETPDAGSAPPYTCDFTLERTGAICSIRCRPGFVCAATMEMVNSRHISCQPPGADFVVVCDW